MMGIIIEMTITAISIIFCGCYTYERLEYKVVNKMKAKEEITIDDLIMMSCVTITPRKAAAVLGIGYSTIRKMIKEETFPYMDCVIKRGNSQNFIIRAKLIMHITGETYEEQLQHKKRLARENYILNINGRED